MLQGPTATVGVFVDSGSVYETPETTGSSHLLEYLAFKSTQNRTHFRLVREVGLPLATVTRPSLQAGM